MIENPRGTLVSVKRIDKQDIVLLIRPEKSIIRDNITEVRLHLDPNNLNDLIIELEKERDL